MTLLHLLTFSTLFPDSVRTSHGVFVENRLRHLVASGQATSIVLAPVPWFPFTNPRVGAYATFAAVPRFERWFVVRPTVTPDLRRLIVADLEGVSA